MLFREGEFQILKHTFKGGISAFETHLYEVFQILKLTFRNLSGFERHLWGISDFDPTWGAFRILDHTFRSTFYILKHFWGEYHILKPSTLTPSTSRVAGDVSVHISAA